MGSVNTPDVVAEAIAITKKASELREAAIAQLLSQREQIDRDLATLGYEVPNKQPKSQASAAAEQLKGGSTVRFRNGLYRTLTLAQVGKILLQEHGTLHGKEIERLARQGGFKGGTKNFQTYLPIAFRRDGSFENIGGNTWKLKEAPEEK